MARKFIQEDEVFEAARELVARGEQPTTLKISQILGRGSYSTITKHLGVWKESPEAAEARADALPAEVEVPASLMEDTAALAKKLWTAAKAKSNETLEIERQALADAKADYETEVETAVNMSDQAVAKREAAEDQLELVESEREQLFQDNNKLSEQLELQTKQILALENTLNELNEKYTIRLEEKQMLREKATEAQAKLEAEKDLTLKMEAKQEADLDRLIQGNEKSTAILLEQHDKALVARDAALAEEKSAAERNAKAMQKQLSEEQVKSAASAVKLEQQAEKLGDLKAQLSGAKTSLSDAKETIAALQNPAKKKSGKE